MKREAETLRELPFTDPTPRPDRLQRGDFVILRTLPDAALAGGGPRARGPSRSSRSNASSGCRPRPRA
jgi:hypothetical protein